MNANYEAKLNMYLTVQTFLKENEKIYSELKALNAFIGNLAGFLDELKTKYREYETIMLGKTELKAATREKLNEVAINNKEILRSYANAINNIELINFVSITNTELKNLRIQELEVFITKLLEEIGKYSKDLEDYGINESNIENFKTIIKTFNNASRSKEQNVLTKTGIKQNLDDKYKVIDMLLKNNIDPLIKPFELTNKDFFTGYTNARAVKDVTRRGKKETDTEEEIEATTK